MIVKLQRPLSDPDTPFMVYDRDRDFQQLVAEVPDTVLAALGDDAKGYFAVIVTSPDRIVWCGRVHDQDW